MWVTGARHGDGQGQKPRSCHWSPAAGKVLPSGLRHVERPPCLPASQPPGKKDPPACPPSQVVGTAVPPAACVVACAHARGHTCSHVRPPRAHTCCGPAHRRSQLPGGHRTLVGSAGSLCHQQHLCSFPGNPLPCTLGLGPEGSVRRSVALTTTVTF